MADISRHQVAFTNLGQRLSVQSSHGLWDGNDTVIIFKTSPSSATGSRFLQISWGVLYCPFPSKLSFSYHLNPVLSSLPNVSMHVSGGCGFPLRGSNLDCVTVSRLFVTNSVTKKSESALCRSGAQELFCFTPNITQNRVSSNDSFYYTVNLDEIFYPNQSLVTVVDDPVVDSIGDVSFSPEFEKQISITGSHFTGGCSEEEITIFVGVLRCKITFISENKLTCTPPSSPLDGFSKFPVKVQIGNYRKTVGNLLYLKFWKTQYFIGIMCGIGAFIILVIVVAVIISCYRHRKSQQGLSRSQPKDSERIVTASDNHYTQLQIINSGFEDYVQSVNITREPKLTLPPNLTETELMKEFLQRIDPSLMESVKASIISGSQLVPGKTWVNAGKYAQIIDGLLPCPIPLQRTKSSLKL
ncbi:uncharacterized protein LOC112564069 [Pomacea canaliculata]|uniref:uncharacterized protein LOC112564069 n=1 Tax=Pomacea canaliculata TaxID=400727 RepID=UPI000D72DACE|nr:uncharacterized protein LOC112564069 [Pomacea canaliculata]